MVNILKRMRKLNELLTIRNGPGAAILPQTQDPQTHPQVTRIHLAFPLKHGDTSITGARAFWRQHLRRLKYHNPGLPITVQHDKTKRAHPRELTIFWSDRPPKREPDRERKKRPKSGAAGDLKREAAAKQGEEKAAERESELKSNPESEAEAEGESAVKDVLEEEELNMDPSKSQPSTQPEGTSQLSPPPSLSPTPPPEVLSSSQSSTPDSNQTPERARDQDQSSSATSDLLTPNLDLNSSPSSSSSAPSSPPSADADSSTPPPSSPSSSSPSSPPSFPLKSRNTQTLPLPNLSSRLIWRWLAFHTGATPVAMSESDTKLSRQLQSFEFTAELDRVRVREGVESMRREEEMRRRAREEAERMAEGLA